MCCSQYLWALHRQLNERTMSYLESHFFIWDNMYCIRASWIWVFQISKGLGEFLKHLAAYNRLVWWFRTCVYIWIRTRGTRVQFRSVAWKLRTKSHKFDLDLDFELWYFPMCIELLNNPYRVFGLIGMVWRGSGGLEWFSAHLE